MANPESAKKRAEAHRVLDELLDELEPHGMWCGLALVALAYHEGSDLFQPICRWNHLAHDGARAALAHGCVSTAESIAARDGRIVKLTTH